VVNDEWSMVKRQAARKITMPLCLVALLPLLKKGRAFRLAPV